MSLNDTRFEPPALNTFAIQQWPNFTPVEDYQTPKPPPIEIVSPATIDVVPSKKPTDMPVVSHKAALHADMGQASSNILTRTDGLETDVPKQHTQRDGNTTARASISGIFI